MTSYYIIFINLLKKKFLLRHCLICYNKTMRIRKENDILQEEDIKLIASASDALAHPLRVELFRYIYTENISRRKVCTKDMVAVTGYSQSTVSQHMRKLLISGLVDAKKSGAFTYYYVNLGILGKYLAAVKKLNSPL